MEESFNTVSSADGLAAEFNNNLAEWKCINGFETKEKSPTMPCNTPMPSTDTPCNGSSDFHIIDINPSYVTSISTYKYETFKLTAAHVTRNPCESGRLAQMKVNTKLKRCRKPYQLPNRSATCSLMCPGNARKKPPNQDFKIASSHCQSDIDQSSSNRVASLLDLPTSRTYTNDLLRSRSLEDLRSLAKTTTVLFRSEDCKPDAELEKMSNILSNLCVTENRCLEDT